MEWVQGEQVPISGNDENGVGRECAGEHLIIIRVATDRRNHGRAYQLGEGAITSHQIRDGATDLDDALGELLAGEDILKFGDERGAGEETQALFARRG